MHKRDIQQSLAIENC